MASSANKFPHIHREKIQRNLLKKNQVLFTDKAKLTSVEVAMVIYHGEHLVDAVESCRLETTRRDQPMTSTNMIKAAGSWWVVYTEGQCPAVDVLRPPMMIMMRHVGFGVQLWVFKT